MDCKRILEDLTAYLDGELTKEENTQVKTHLDTCPNCQKEARLYAETWGMLDQVSQLTPNPQLINNIKKSLRPTRPTWTRWYNVAGLAAAAGIIIALGLLLLTNTPTETTLPETIVQVNEENPLINYYTELLAEYEATEYTYTNGKELETLSPYLFAEQWNF